MRGAQPRRSRTAGWLWTPLAAAAIGCAHSAPPPDATAPVVSSSPPLSSGLERRLAGTYAYAGGADEKAAVTAAVNRAVDGMGIATGFARSALLKRSEIRPSYTIAFDARGVVDVETPGYPAEVSPSDGTEVKLTNRDGDESQISQRVVGGVLVQQGRTDQGKGQTRFTLQPDGKTLVVTRVMESSELPRPVEFTLTYVRQASL
jgi:hypothetical protein